MLKKILAVVVLAALAYTAYTILQCTVMTKSASAGKSRPVKAASMLASAYKANIQSQQATQQELNRMDVLDKYSPTLGISKVMGARGMVQELILASAARARASK